MLYGGAPETDRQKVTVCAMDKARWERELYHPGVHSKILIADDTLAIIGSTNVNRRSLTLDSETALVIFDEKLSPRSFALRFRQATWKEFSKRKDLPATYDGPSTLPKAVRRTSHYIVTEYTSGDVEDADVAVKKVLRNVSVHAGVLNTEIDALFFHLWDHVIDPWVDD